MLVVVVGCRWLFVVFLLLVDVAVKRLMPVGCCCWLSLVVVVCDCGWLLLLLSG